MMTATKTHDIRIVLLGQGDDPSIVEINGIGYYLFDNGTATFRVEKFFSQGGECYKIDLIGGRARICSCPDWKWRQRHFQGACKHARCVDKYLSEGGF